MITKVVKLRDLIDEIDECAKNKKPFSLIRYGDGGVKYIHALLNNDIEQINQICKKEGIPHDKLYDVLKSWAYFSSNANYIDTPQVYYDKQFWPRCRKNFKPLSGKTDKRLRMWRELYDLAEFDNVNYCNPEINFLLCLRIGNYKNILNLMNKYKIGFITARPKVLDKLKKYNVDIIEIVGHYEDHYNASFKNIIKRIESDVLKYDIWLISAGELGRIYTGLIKHLGGIAIDMGFIAEYWETGEIPSRLTMFLQQNPNNRLEFKLTEDSLQYKEFL